MATAAWDLAPVVALTGKNPLRQLTAAGNGESGRGKITGPMAERIAESWVNATNQPTS